MVDISIADATVEQILANQKGLIAIGAGLAVGLSGIASGIAEKDIGAAAVGAMAEREELFGKGLILTVIPETIVIFGLVVAILLLFL
ncbi:MAG: V-type ATP synthase subunit K [ANME-2 cluster archaeon]|jgi:V/A-type H+-transporting ATPase subunit K|nr:MAG: V/A-type H+-transporting ATPase subunit K [ANME-2 cluster archaeon]MCD4765372.1 V-type ATP synthase subunit K [Methanosarcinales archaeon]MBA1341233.1 Membrane-associated ATPase C chain [ANME-2 cluster archaeon]MBC2698807.1 V-type ATP synthase subunit K [ANME-2 cluster archaeon]MBC2701352.1 V-type ATP synthase subunit K [ANME-2 cluster archaeon]